MTTPAPVGTLGDRVLSVVDEDVGVVEPVDPHVTVAVALSPVADVDAVDEQVGSGCVVETAVVDDLTGSPRLDAGVLPIVVLVTTESVGATESGGGCTAVVEGARTVGGVGPGPVLGGAAVVVLGDADVDGATLDVGAAVVELVDAALVGGTVVTAAVVVGVGACEGASSEFVEPEFVVGVGPDPEDTGAATVGPAGAGGVVEMTGAVEELDSGSDACSRVTSAAGVIVVDGSIGEPSSATCWLRAFTAW